MKTLISMAMLVTASGCLAPFPKTPNTAHVISGRVSDSDTDQAIEGATVKLVSNDEVKYETTTDEYGGYTAQANQQRHKWSRRFSGADQTDPRTLRVSHPDYQSTTVIVLKSWADGLHERRLDVTMNAKFAATNMSANRQRTSPGGRGWTEGKPRRMLTR